MVSAAICLTALIGCLSVSAATRGEGTFTVGSDSGKPGENVTVDVTLEYTKAPDGTAPEDGSKYGIAATLFDVQFNKEKLEIVSIKSGETIEGNLGQRTYRVDYRTSDGDNVYIDENNCVRILAQAAGVNEEDGTVVPKIIATLEFKIKEGTAACDIPVTIYKQEVCDYGAWQANESGDFEYSPDAEFIYMTVTNGKITVTEDHVHTELTSTLTDVTETAFVYSCVCSECSETYVKEVQIGTPVDTLALPYAIEPKNDMSILCEVSKSEVDGIYTNLTLIAEKETYLPNVAESTINTTYITSYKDSQIYSGYYEFTFNNIAAYEMNNNITFTLYGLNESGEMVRLAQKQRSVVDYVSSQLSKATDESFKKALVDMVNYGTYMQIYSKQNVANLANSFLSEEQKTWGTSIDDYPTEASQCNALDSSVTKTAILNSDTEAGEVKISKSLSPSSKINLEFVITQHAGNLSNYYCVFEYYPMKGVKETVTKKYDDSLWPGTDYPMFVFDLAPVTLMDYPVTATIYYGNPDEGGIPVSKTVYSVETYISSQLSKTSGDFLLALQSMFAYGNAMAEYANVDPYVSE